MPASLERRGLAMRKRTIKLHQEGDTDEPQLATSLVRALSVLRAFRPGDGPLGNQDLLARTGLPKATISRIMYTLSALGYLVYDEALGRYSLGPATVSLGYTALSSNAVVHMARPLMQKLADRTGAAVALGTRDGPEMVYLANCRSESLVSLRLNPGSHLPIWKTAMGLSFLAGLDADERDEIVARLRAAEPEAADKMAAAIAGARAQYANRGYVASVGLWHSYISAVGVPFRPRDGSPPVAITCGGISEMITAEAIEGVIGPALVELVAKLRASLEGERIDAAAGVEANVAGAASRERVHG